MQQLLTRLLVLLVSTATMLMVGVGLSGPAQAGPRPADPSTADVTGTLPDGKGSVDGTFDVSRFTVDNGELMAVGTFTGTITDATTTLAQGSQQVALPVDVAQSDGDCRILNLVLGPLDLNLLGLQVDLAQVVLDITAQQGPGKLLGNLLCAVAGLLDGPTGVNALLQQIAGLLNRVLGALG